MKYQELPCWKGYTITKRRIKLLNDNRCSKIDQIKLILAT